MKRSRLVFLIIGVSIIFFGCSKDDFSAPDLGQSDQQIASLKSAKTSSKLVGIMDLYFNLAFLGDPNLPVWEGTISFDGTEYGMRFFSLSEQKGFSKASPFEERFEIYDLGDETVYLAGFDEGVTTLANSKYRMNGEVDTSIGPFDGWLDRPVHMSGVITWQELTTPDGIIVLPATAPGTFRMN